MCYLQVFWQYCIMWQPLLLLERVWHIFKNKSKVNSPCFFMLINIFYKWLFIHPEVELAISERSSQWFIDFLFITRDSRKSNKLCGRKTTKQNGFTLWIRFLLLSFCLVSWSWVRLRRNRVHFPTHTHIVFNDACVSLVQWSISKREDSHPEVELGLTGLTSTSWYVLTTRSESFASYQSSVSVLGVRPRILCSWTRHRRNGVRFPKHPHGLIDRLRCSGPTSISKRDVSYPICTRRLLLRSTLQGRGRSYRCLLLCRRHSANARLRLGIQWWLLFQLGIG